jgi:hypothetical protein
VKTINEGDAAAKVDAVTAGVGAINGRWDYY